MPMDQRVLVALVREVDVEVAASRKRQSRLSIGGAKTEDGGGFAVHLKDAFRDG